MIDFLNFVENDILTPPPPPQTSEEAVTENSRQGFPERLTSEGAIGPIDESEEEESEDPPIFQMRRNSIVRAINRTRNRRRGMFFQQFMNHLMDNADEQILQQVMHESFVEDQEKRKQRVDEGMIVNPLLFSHCLKFFLGVINFSYKNL